VHCMHRRIASHRYAGGVAWAREVGSGGRETPRGSATCGKVALDPPSSRWVAAISDTGLALRVMVR